MCNPIPQVGTGNWYRQEGRRAEVERRRPRVVFSGSRREADGGEFNAAGDAGRPQELFTVRTAAPTPYRQNYHPSSDGQRFAINAVAERNSSAAITVIVNSPVLVK